MKTIVAVIRPFKLDEVKQMLQSLGVMGMTVTEARGFGRQKGHGEIYRGAEYEVSFVPKMRIETVVSDEQVDGLVKGIITAVGTGEIGDRKIWVLPAEQLVWIRTGEKGEDAL